MLGKRDQHAMHMKVSPLRTTLSSQLKSATGSVRLRSAQKPYPGAAPLESKLPPPSQRHIQSNALNLQQDDPDMDQIGLLPVPQDCEMPDINWEEYDNIDEPSKPHQPVRDICSSRPIAQGRSSRITPDPNPAGDHNPQNQTPSVRYNGNAPTPRRENIGMQRKEDKLPVPRRAPQRPKDANANNFEERSDANSQRKASGQRIAEEKGRMSKRKWCSLCDIYVTSASNMPAHIKGKKHQSNLKGKRLTSSNEKLDRPYKHTERTAVDKGGVDRKNEDDPARNSGNSRMSSQGQFGPANTTRSTRKGNERASNYPHAGGGKRASNTNTSNNACATDTDKRGWNAHYSSHPRAGSSDHAIPNIHKYGASSFRPSQHARHQVDTGRSGMDIDKSSAPPAGSSNAASMQTSQRAATRGVEESGWRLRSGEPIPQGGRSEVTPPRLRGLSTAQRSRKEGGASSIGGKSMLEVRPTDRVETLKPIPWDPFASEYDESKVGKQGRRIPQDFLDEKMSISEWRELRRAVFEKGDDVDKLAFKILAEMLLSPTLGVREDALDGLNSAIKKMKNEHYYSKETGSYMSTGSIPEKLWQRERRFVEGDEEWMKAQSNESKALHLMCENLHYMFDQSEDVEAVAKKAHFSTLPFRGGVTGVRSSAGRMIDGQDGRRIGDVDAVENDELFREIHEFLLAQKMRPAPRE